MLSYALNRLPQMVVALLGASILAFLLVRLSGDPVQLLISQTASKAEIDAMRHELGLDRPLLVQYWNFLSRAIRGDLGKSLRYHEPALALVLERVPVTAQLALAALAASFVVALPAGVVSALRRGSVLDVLATSAALAGQSMPIFWTGILLILLFSVTWRMFPSSGTGGVAYLILPAVTLATDSVGRFTRLIRSSVLEVLTQDYVYTARAKGLRDRRVLFVHILRNAALPMVTLLGQEFAALLGGAVITESVFAWPGMGRLVLTAIYTRDYPVVQAALLFTTVVFLVLNLLVDVSYSILDPRIRYQ